MTLFLSIGYCSFFTLIPESFPTDIRGIGSGFVGIFGRIGGIISPLITNLILQFNNGGHINIAIFALIFLICALSILPLKETKAKKAI